jgi:hypothetical protein
MALLSSRGISTPSLQARGEQRRFFYFNNDRDIPPAVPPDSAGGNGPRAYQTASLSMKANHRLNIKPHPYIWRHGVFKALCVVESK